MNRVYLIILGWLPPDTHAPSGRWYCNTACYDVIKETKLTFRLKRHEPNDAICHGEERGLLKHRLDVPSIWAFSDSPNGKIWTANFDRGKDLVSRSISDQMHAKLKSVQRMVNQMPTRWATA